MMTRAACVRGDFPRKHAQSLAKEFETPRIPQAAMQPPPLKRTRHSGRNGRQGRKRQFEGIYGVPIGPFHIPELKLATAIVWAGQQ